MKAMKRKYNTPKRKIVVMTRLTENEKLKFDELLSQTNFSQAEFLRKSILKKNFRIRQTITNDSSLHDLQILIGNLGKIGGNINQIAKHLNQGGIPQYLVNDVSRSLHDLEDTKFKIIELVGKWYGNN